MKKIKSKTKVAIVVLIAILLIPIALNFLLQVSIKGIFVIGNDNSETVWLSFFGSYIGAIITSLVAFYILYIDRKDNFNVIQYQNECSTFRKGISDLITYTAIYDKNHIRAIYNKWISAQHTGSVELCEQVKFLMDRATIAYGMLTVYEPVGSRRDFFIEQESNYHALADLLKDFSVLVGFNSSEFNIPKEFKKYLCYFCLENKVKGKAVSDKFMENLDKQENQETPVFDVLLETYKDIDFENIDAQVKEFINSEREALNLKFKDMQ